MLSFNSFLSHAIICVIFFTLPLQSGAEVVAALGQGLNSTSTAQTLIQTSIIPDYWPTYSPAFSSHTVPWAAAPDWPRLAAYYSFALGSSYRSSQWPAELRDQLVQGIVQDQGWSDSAWDFQIQRAAHADLYSRALAALLSQRVEESQQLLNELIQTESTRSTSSLSSALLEWLRFYQALAVHYSGDSARAGQLLGALTLHQQGSNIVKDGVPTAVLLDWSAHLARSQGELEVAELAYRRALIDEDGVLVTKEYQLAKAQRLENLADLLLHRKQYYSAEKLYREALEVYLTQLGPWHQRSSQGMKQLAFNLEQLEQWQEALVFRQQALILDEEIHGMQHPLVADSLAALAHTESQLDQWESALARWQRAYTIDQAFFGMSSPKLALRLNHLAFALKHMGRYQEAETSARQVVNITQAYYGASHPAVALAVKNLASLLTLSGAHKESETLLRRAIQIDEITLGANDLTLVSDFNSLAHLLHRLNRYAESEYYMRRCLEILYQHSQSQGFPHPYLASLVEDYSLILSEMGYNSPEIDRRLHFLMPAS